ncbi:helix-turn-helix domain-containing protein [Hominenteromicrobium sp.]|uniref:helix-turn-helix domain-containing protein n=1 Tax=Hominenteromicrobium sp. TaxID=3073581 RepID=UPI003A8DDFE6
MNDFYATLDLNINSLTPRSVKLLAFLQAHADKEGVSFWSKRKTCEALGISESTYARALRELTRAGLVEVKPRFDENGRQRSNTYRVVNTKGLKYRADMDDVEKLHHREMKVYSQIMLQIGEDSWAISRRSLADACGCSKRSISRLVAALRDKGILCVRAEDRSFMGNKGQSFNRFRRYKPAELLLLRCILLMLLSSLNTPVVKCDTPMNPYPQLQFLFLVKEKGYTVFRVYRKNRVNRKNQLYRKYKRAKVALCGEERNIMTEIIYAKPQYKQSRMPGKELCWRVPEDMPLKNEKWALVPCKEHLYLVEILRKEWVEDNIAEQYRRVYAIGSTREELKPPIGRVHLIDADRIGMPGEVSYHAVENSKLSKPDVMELLQYPIGVTLEAGGRYRVFLGAYRFWYLRECLHWTKIPCYVYKIKRQIRDPRERRRREIHRRQQAAESPRIRLQLYENYYKLLKGMKDAGEIKGGLQMRLMQLLGISERTVRIYKQLSEQLTGREKQRLMRGKLPFVQARAIAAERNQKAAMLPDFEKAEKTKDKKLPANSVSRFLSYKEQLLCCKI